MADEHTPPEEPTSPPDEPASPPEEPASPPDEPASKPADGGEDAQASADTGSGPASEASSGPSSDSAPEESRGSEEPPATEPEADTRADWPGASGADEGGAAPAAAAGGRSPRRTQALRLGIAAVIALAVFGAGYAIGTSRGDDDLSHLPKAGLFQRYNGFEGSPGWRHGDRGQQQRGRFGDNLPPGWHGR